MEVKRVFHPVGQGGFYTEDFDNQHMVVYDCGGTQSVIKTYLDKFLQQQNTTIDAVFISHLHQDHINGLPFLLKKATVKRLFVPFLTPERIIETALYNAANYSNSELHTANEFLISAVRGRYQEAQIIQISEASLENNLEEYDSFNLNEDYREVIKSGTHIYTGSQSNRTNPGTHGTQKPKWVYIPFNIPSAAPDFSCSENDEQLQNDIKKLEELYNNLNNDKIQICEQLAQLLESHDIEHIVKIYKQLFGENIHNSQSMAVFSGVIIQKDEYIDIKNRNNLYHGFLECQYRHYGPKYIVCRWECEDKIPCNFLYMGDYEVQNQKNYNALKLFYNKHQVWDTICGVQIPHHGSHYNYCMDFYKDKCFAVASYGTQNKFNHPSIEVLLRIAQAGCSPNVINEDINTLKYQHFTIS